LPTAAYIAEAAASISPVNVPVASNWLHRTGVEFDLAALIKRFQVVPIVVWKHPMPARLSITQSLRYLSLYLALTEKSPSSLYEKRGQFCMQGK